MLTKQESEIMESYLYFRRKVEDKRRVGAYVISSSERTQLMQNIQAQRELEQRMSELFWWFVPKEGK